MANNLPQYQPRNAVSDVLQHMHRLNPGGMGGIMGRGSGGYNPANAGPALTMGPLSTTFTGSGAGENAPSPLDLSEFPSLSRGGSSSAVLADAMTVGGGHVGGRPGATYGGLSHGWGGMKQPVSEPSEFTMSSEDFPALPGSHKQPKIGGSNQQHQQHGDSFTSEKKSGSTGGLTNNPSSGSNNNSSNLNESSSEFARSGSLAPGSAVSSALQDKNGQAKRGIQTTPDGTVTNIPSGMVKDQFGMVGLLTFIRAAESETNLVSLALGSDLTSLGLNLNSPENLYPNFGGPWAESPCRPQDIDYHVPQEYLVNHQISMYGRASKLAPIQFERYGEDLLFYIFYSNPGDVWQLMAASELYNRDWRYHKEEQVWITRAPGMPPSEKGPTFERGTYFYFDVQNWRKVPKEFHLLYEKLDNQPMVAPALATTQQKPQHPQQLQQQQVQQQQQQQQQVQQQQHHHNHHTPTTALS